MTDSPATTALSLELPVGPLGATGAVPAVAAAERPAIPGFEVGEALGKGGMGVVYRARELATARDVAVKWLPAHAEEELRKRFEREARAAAAVRHPNIIPILSAGHVDAGAYIVMELVDGFPLSAALAARALGRNALLDVLAKVARALHSAHEGGVVHRDVKPDNIIVDAHGEPRLLDFGLARFLDAEGLLTGKHAALGTVGFVSPEVLTEGGASAGPPCDVFGLGAILHEGLAGEPAFGKGDARTTLMRITRGEHGQLAADTPPALVALVSEALSLDPARRPSALAFAERLEALRKEEPPSRPPPPAQRGEAGRGAPRSSTLSFIAVGVLGAVLGAGLLNAGLKAKAKRLEREKAFSSAGETVKIPDAPVPPPPPPPPAPPAVSPGAALDEAFDEAMAAILRDDRARADAIARKAIEAAPATGEEKRLARLHAILARNALYELRTAEAQREYAAALDLDPTPPQLLLGSCACALVEGDMTLAMKRAKALEEKGPSPFLFCAKALFGVARREGGRGQPLATLAPKVDPPLMKVVVEQLQRR